MSFTSKTSSSFTGKTSSSFTGKTSSSFTGKSSSDLLVVLPGITASRRDCRRGRILIEELTSMPVVYPHFGSRWKLTRCAGHLERCLLERRLSDAPEAKRVHFLNYIRGGMIFLRFMAQRPALRLGNVVFDRGLAAEAIAPRLAQLLGRPTLRALAGSGVLEVADWPHTPWCWRPPAGTRTGVLLETGTPRLARLIGIQPRSYSRAPGLSDLMLEADELLRLPESHDEVYTSPRFLTAAVNFLESGSFHT